MAIKTSFTLPLFIKMPVLYQSRKVSGHECVLGVPIQESKQSRMCVRGTNPGK